MRGLAVVVLLAGCGILPDTQQCDQPQWCEDNRIMTCTTECDGPPDHPENCHPVISERADCDVAAGVAKACAPTVTTNGEQLACVDVDRQPCSPVGAESCAPASSRSRVCIDTPTGPIWNTGDACAGADACLATDQGDTICVPPGTPACAAGTPDRCEADTLVYCIGNPTDGYVELRGSCPGCTIDATGNASCT